MSNKYIRYWLKIWNGLQAKGDGILVYQDLVMRYSESHRHFHTFTGHIEHGVAELIACGLLPATENKIGMMWFGHDAIYDPNRSDNEERSAQFIANILVEAGVSSIIVGKIFQGIIATKKHESDDKDIQLLIDVDLSVLGQPIEVFDLYEQQIRKEYEHVPLVLFSRKRAEILKGILEKGDIYYTPRFKDRYEAQALMNIWRSVRNLEKVVLEYQDRI